MDFQEIVVILFVSGAAYFAVRTFVKQFLSSDGSCSSCSCEPLPQKISVRNRNEIRFKKKTSL